MSAGSKEHKPATKLVEAGRKPEWTGRVVNPPVVRASTHLYASEAERTETLKNNHDGVFYYGRRGAQTSGRLSKMKVTLSLLPLTELLALELIFVIFTMLFFHLQPNLG